MGMPQYTSEKFKNAGDKYKALAEKYYGENGLNKNSKLASETSAESSKGASTVARANALNAGYGRARAAREGANAAAKAYNDNYNSAYTNAENQNNKMMESYKNFYDNAHQQKVNEYNAGANALAGLIKEIGPVLTSAIGSDENLKCINNKTSEERRQELLERLRGI